MKCILLVVVCINIFTASAQWKGFSEFNFYPVAKQVNLFHIKDMDGDQLPDIVNFYSALENKFSIVKGKSDATFSAEKTFDKPVNYHLSDIADLNKDGYNDIIISSYWDNGFRIFWGNHKGDYSQNKYFGAAGHGKNIKCVDINKDGSTDILFTTSGSGQPITLYVYINKGNGEFEAARTFPSMLDTSKEILITDKNGDGLPDIVVSSSFPWLLFYFQQPGGSFKAQYWETFTTAYTVFKDLDHDGNEDMIMLYPSFENIAGSDSIIIKKSLAGDGFAESVRVPLLANKKIKPSIILVHDINNDGKQDILLNHLSITDERTDTAYYMLGRGNFVFDEPVLVRMPGAVVKMQLVDINADSYPDWIVSCTNNTIAVALNNKDIDNTPVDGIRLYPNPSAGELYIDRLNNEQYDVRIYSVAGSLLQQFKISGSYASIDISQLSQGIYLIELRSNKRKLVKKFVKQ